MTTTPNMGIYIPTAGQTNYDQAFRAGMLNVDQHDHSGAPNKGVPISSAGIAAGSITKDKLNTNVVSLGEGLAIDGANPNALIADGLLNALYKLNVTGIIARTGAGTVAARTITGTANRVTVSNGNGVSGDPAIDVTAQSIVKAYINASTAAITGSNEIATVVFDTEVFDVGSGYNPATGIFTAPETRTYLFCVQIQFEGLNASITDGESFIETTGGDYQIGRNNFGAIRTAGAQALVGLSTCIPVQMNAGDTAQVRLQINQGATTVFMTGGSDRNQLQIIRLF